MKQTRKAVEAITADARTRARHFAVFLIHENAERQGERVMAQAHQVVVQLLDARLIAHRRIAIRRTGGRLRRVDSPLAVYMIKILRFGVVGLKVLVAQRPGPGYAVVMDDFAEVLLAQAQQGGAVELGIAAHVVLDARVERTAFLVDPGFPGLVLVIDEDGGGVPIVSLARQVTAAF